MIDDDHDKKLMRNQIVALVLMAGLLFFWMTYLAPKYAKTPPPAQNNAAAVLPEATQGPAPSNFQDPLSGEALPAYREASDQGLASALPPAVTAPESPADLVVIENENLRLTFTKVGGRLKEALIKLGKQHGDSIQLIPAQPGQPEPIYPFSMYFTDMALGDALNHRSFESQVDPAGNSVTFTLTLPGAMTVRKKFTLTDRAGVVGANISIENLRNTPLTFGLDQKPAYLLAWGPNVDSQDLTKGIAQTLIWHKDGANDSLPTAKLAIDSDGRPVVTSVPGADWLAVKSPYFIVAFKPEFDNATGMAYGNAEQFRFGLGVPRAQIAPATTISNDFSVYFGPNHLQHLKDAWPTLSTALKFYESPTWAWLDWFAKFLLSLLNWFYDIYPSYGVAIILLTLLVRVALFPLTLKSMKSMKRMSLLAPEIEELKKKYPDNPQEQQKKMMELYRERGISPLGGCLPMLLQMPIFFALYRMLMSAYELRGAPYLWMQDLSQPDCLFRIPGGEHIPFFGGTLEYFNVLPILMAVAMMLSQKLVPASGPSQNPQQKIIMTIMPVFFSVICYNMASGLNLYILVSTLLGIAQQPLIKVSQADVATKKVPRKRMHFYAAAQARKRRLAKEEGKKGPKAKS